MKNYTKKLQDELNACGKEALFEIEVTDANGEQDFIVCEVYFKDDSIIAEREAVNNKEWESRYVACDKLIVDECFSLDEHLQELHAMVIDSINEGELFTLAN